MKVNRRSNSFVNTRRHDQGWVLIRLYQVIILMLLAGTFGAIRVQAFPEYQAFVQKNSGRPVDCSLCHVNPEGPLGTGPGQIGKLTPDEMAELNQARTALLPGQDIKNPILNEFGNKIIADIGMKKCLALRSSPAALAPLLNQRRDLDGDGIPDAREYLAGTSPIDNASGDPWQLFTHNLARNSSEILTATLSALFCLFGLLALLRGYEQKYAAEAAAEPVEVAIISDAAVILPADDDVAQLLAAPDNMDESELVTTMGPPVALHLARHHRRSL